MLNGTHAGAPLECPLCRATRFCCEAGGETADFSVVRAGAAFDCVPAAAARHGAGAIPPRPPAFGPPRF